MADEFAKKTADDFRRLGGQPSPPRPAPIEPAGPAGPAGPAAPRAAAPGSDVRQALAAVVREAVTSGNQEIVERLAALERQLADGTRQQQYELKNGLPSRLRQELHEQQRPMTERLAALEAAVGALRTGPSLASRIATAAVFALVAAMLLSLVIIFERPLRNWGHDTLFPLFGIGITQAAPVPPRQVKAPPLGDR
jgi:hypothetical protein